MNVLSNGSQLVRAFSRKPCIADANEMANLAAEDYAAARCLAYSEFPLQSAQSAAQAVEKQLKAVFLYYEGAVVDQAIEKHLEDVLLYYEGAAADQVIEKHREDVLLYQKEVLTRLRKTYGHKLLKLYVEVEKRTNCTINQIGLKDFLERLEKAFKYRYYDNDHGSLTIGGTDLALLDTLMFELQELFPVPEDVRFRVGLFAVFFGRDLKRLQRWIVKDNEYLTSRRVSLERRIEILLSSPPK